MVNIYLTASRDKFFKVEKFLHYVSCTNQEIAFCGQYQNEQEKKLSFEIYQVLYSAIVQTDDGEIRQCVCFCDQFAVPTWIDIHEYDERFTVFDYKNYSEKINLVHQKPLDYLTYIAVRLLDSSQKPEEIVADDPIQEGYCFPDGVVIKSLSV